MLTRLMILAGFALTLVTASAAHADRRVALVVGNSAYASAASLRNPRNDASDMAETLKKLGFEVELGLDLDQQNFAVTIEKFARALDGADVGLFFYAGHGLQLNDKNYLVSINAKLENEFLMSSETIDLTAIVRLMESKTPVNLVFLDACRNNPLAENLRRGLEVTKRSANLGRGLARIEPASRDTLIAFAAAPGQVAADGNDRNSPFTASLLKNLPRPAVEVSVMLKEVSADVRRATNNSQRPQQLSDMSRTFYFASAAPTVVNDASAPEQAAKTPSSVVPQGDDRAFDVAFWNAAQSANECESTRAYLARFPNGIFVDLAKLAERRLCKPSRQVTVVESAPPAPSLTPAPATPATSPAAPAVPSFVPPALATEPPASTTAPSAVIAALPEPSPAPPASEAGDPDLVRNTQLELIRLGCSTGDADGNWGKSSSLAISRFNRFAKASLNEREPSSATLSALREHDERVCPLTCGRGFRAQDDTCVAIEHEHPRNSKAERAKERRERASIERREERREQRARRPREEEIARPPLRPAAPRAAPQSTAHSAEMASPLCQSRIQNAAGKWCCTYDPPRGPSIIICR
jgi:uncharacterized caspase-like protein